MAEIGAVQTGAISTQVEAAKPPRVEETPVAKTQETQPPPPPPPAESGRGENIDTSA